MVSDIYYIPYLGNHSVIFILRYNKLFSLLFYSFFFVDAMKSGISYVHVRRVENNIRATYSFGENQLATRKLSAFPLRHGNNSWPFNAVRSSLFSIYYAPVILAAKVS